jgi:hypothetical protein
MGEDRHDSDTGTGLNNFFKKRDNNTISHGLHLMHLHYNVNLDTE